MKNWFSVKHRMHVQGASSFRGLACFLIFIFHFWGFFLQDTSLGIFAAPFNAGHIGLDMFFVLTGMLLFLSMAREGEITKDFFMRRIKRLVPLSLIFTVTIFVFKKESIKNLIFHLFFIQSLSMDTYWGLNPVMWTLTVEILFIILLPCLLILTRKRLIFIINLVLLIILNFLYRMYVFQFFPEWSVSERIFYSEQLWGRLDQFILGVFLGMFFASSLKGKIGKILSHTALLTGIFGFLGCLVIFSNLGSDFRESLFLQTFLHFFTALFFSLVIFGFNEIKRPLLKKIIAPEIFKYFSYVSYSFFLWHFPCLSLTHKMGFDGIWAFLFSFSLSLILSIVSFVFVEKKFYKQKPRTEFKLKQ
ncbi:MAG: acyltransferase [Candidatus Gracilibacteria bacterium]|jgi:peptidoglycan/LPS O-acetylase OafA/YrhL|nr:acyltransferase [Candidatus Gracilibacteria bacterium]